MILKDMIDTAFSHNSLITLWETDEEDKNVDDKIWDGMAYQIPETLLNREAIVFGAWGDEEGYINIHLENEETL